MDGTPQEKKSDYPYREVHFMMPKEKRGHIYTDDPTRESESYGASEMDEFYKKYGKYYVEEVENLHEKELETEKRTYGDTKINCVEVDRASCTENGIEILDYSFADNQGDLSAFIEFKGIRDRIPSNIRIKINLYDEKKNLYLMQQMWICNEDFYKYDTVQIFFYDNGKVLERATSAKIFVVAD